MLGCLRALFLLLTTGKTQDRYCIKSWYLPRSKYHHFDARTSGEVHQDLIYREIKEFFDAHEMRTLLDIGCGTGFKLIKYFGDDDALGLERPPALDFLKESYPERRWQLSDFDQVPEGHFDMVISVDVIEHLPDPDQLMAFIAEIDCDYVALSTPDRDRLSRRSRLGPPRNPHHMREWSQEEFVRYVSRHFEVLRSKVLKKHEHYVICRKS